MTKTSKLKSGGIILSFITLTIIILFSFRFLEKRLNASEIKITSKLNTINWANIQERGEGLQPKYIEEYITQDIDKINNLIHDLNKVRENGELEAVQRQQQELILLIHQFPNPTDLENKLSNNFQNLVFKENWDDDSEYSIRQSVKDNQKYVIKNRTGGEIFIDLHLPDTNPTSGTKYIIPGGHHNRLKPSKKNNFVKNINDWENELDRDFFQGEKTQEKKSLLSRILYTYKYSDAANYNIYDYMFREGKRSEYTDSALKEMYIREFINNIVNLFHPNGEYFNETYNKTIIDDDFFDNGEYEPVDPYYRILYSGYDSKQPEGSIIGDSFWPLYEEKDTNSGSTKRNDIINIGRPRGGGGDPVLITYSNNTEEPPFIFKNLNTTDPNGAALPAPNPISLSTAKKFQGFAFNKPSTTIFSEFLSVITNKDKRKLQFLADPITRMQPIWPLKLPTRNAKLHKSKGPILKDENGSFETTDMLSLDKSVKFFETKFIGKLLSKIDDHKKIFSGITFVYLTASIYYLIHLNKKSKRKNNESLADYKKRTKNVNKIKKILLILFPITYYIFGLFAIVSYFRWKQENNPNTKTNDTLTNLKNMESLSEKNPGSSLFTNKHIDLLKKKISYYEDLSIQPLKFQTYVSSGLGIFSISFMLYIILQLFKKFPIESKIASIIVAFVGIVGIGGYLLFKYKDFLLAFVPKSINIFGTKNPREIIIILIILSVLACILYVLFSNKKLISLKTNGRMLLDKETNLSDQLKLGKINVNDKFSISSWFYFVPSGNSNSGSYKDYSIFFNFNWNPIMMINTQNGNLKIIFEDKTFNQQIIYDSPIELQKWNNIIINYDGSTADIFINANLVGTKKNIYIDNNLTYLDVGNINNINSKICNVKNSTMLDSSCNSPNDNVRCFTVPTKSENKVNKIVCGKDNCQETLTSNCGFSDENINGGMANIVYYDNILKLGEINKNYEVFNKFLKNKVY